MFINRFCRVNDRRITCSISNMKRRNNKLDHCYRSLTVLTRSTTKCTTKPVGEKLNRLAIEFEATAFKAAFYSLFFDTEHTISLSPLPSGLVSEHEQIGGQITRMRYRMSVIYGHPVIAATRALRFADHVTKRNGGSGDENELCFDLTILDVRWPLFFLSETNFIYKYLYIVQNMDKKSMWEVKTISRFLFTGH